MTPYQHVQHTPDAASVPIIGQPKRKPGRPYTGGRKPFTPEYRAWSQMKRRCESKEPRWWNSYGARGIKVFGAWLKDFPAFLTVIGPRPSAQHSLDRIDNAKDYEPGNVRWATKAEQTRNRRNTVMYEGRPLAEWAEEYGLSYKQLWNRVRRRRSGMTLHVALTKPLHQRTPAYD